MAGATKTRATPQPAPAAKPRTAPARKQTPPARPHPSAPVRAVPPAVRLSAGAPAAKLKGLPGTSGGAPLPPEVRAPVEGSFGVSLEAVRVHTNADARATAASLSARALTFGNHIFLGPGERATDTRLIAHEAAHVIQQQGGAAVQRWGAGPGDSFEREAHRASDAAAGGVPFTIRERTSAAKVQRLGISDALDYFADAANAIPGYRMFTVVIGLNPINMSPVARSAANIMRAVVEFIPGGNLVTRALDTYGIFDKVGNWVEQQLRTLGMVGSAFRDALMEFLDSLSWKDIFRLGSVWERAKRIFTAPVRQLIDFAGGLITGILGFLREAVLKPLARLAEGTQGYDLLKAVLGQDPVTGEPVAQNADTLIGGFMKLIGQEEVWQNIKKANAIERAWAWFQGALSGVLAFVRAVPGLIVSTLQSITLEDLLPITNLFVKVGRAFGGFVGSFISWAGGQVLSLLQIIFEVVAPGVMPYVRKAMGAFRTIIQNPIGFVGNLVRAGKQGFQRFAGNFLNHLRRSLIEWLTGTMSGAGVYIPQGFNLREIVKFVLSVLGLTWANIRQKLVRVVGETAVSAMEQAFDIVMTLVREGPAAAWEKIQEALANLREMVMGQVMNYVRDRVVQTAITTLVTSLNPAGAFIQAIIATYNTVMFFVERMRQIARVVASFIDSISAIAAGNVGSAAARVETTMAGMLTLVISFLARLARLGDVSQAVIGVINRLRAPIDRALDRIIDWIVAQARRLGRFVAQAGVPQDPKERVRLGARAAVAVLNRFRGRRIGVAVLRPLLPAIITRYALNGLEPYERNGRWWVRARINPQSEGESEAQTEGGGRPGAAAGDLRERAGELVVQRLGGKHSEEEIESVVNQVRSELAPQGLHFLGFSPENEEGESNLLAQASQPKTTAKKKKAPKPKPKTAIVVMQVKILYDTDALAAIEEAGKRKGQQLRWEHKEIPQPRTGVVPPGGAVGKHEVAPIGTPPSDQQRMGTVLVRPDPGATLAHIVSWNSGEPVPQTNSSHAERHFQEWWVHYAPKVGVKIKAVHIDINYSPCSFCVDSLPNLKDYGVVGTLSYQIPYEGYDKKTKMLYENSTTTEDLGKLSGKGWKLTGGTPPKWTNAKKEEERKKRWAIVQRAW